MTSAVGAVTDGRPPAPAPAPQPYRRGYRPPAAVRAHLAEWHATSPWRSVAAACGDHALAVLAAAGPVLTARHLGVAAALLAIPPGLLLAARAQRGLECLVHEGSHYNWSRGRRKLNDLLTDLFAALPVFEGVAGYRSGHLTHHGRFATAEDPDRQRYAELALEALDRGDVRAFAAGILRRLPRYVRGWWGVIGTRSGMVARALLLHLAVLTTASLAVGPALAVPAWLLWQAAFLLVLPPMRLAAESSEHCYTEADNVFDATISNLGRLQRLLLHPHNDGYHTLHHMWPGIPHHRLRRAHRALVRLDPGGYARRLRYRDRFLSRPSPVRADRIAG